MVKERYALIGWPGAHSASPLMQEAAFKAAGLNASYELIAVPPEKLPEAVLNLKKEGYSGWNVTVPHKEKVLPLIDILDGEAEKIGSVNTILPRQGKLWGYSTDGYGLVKALERNFQLQTPGADICFWVPGRGASGCRICSNEGASVITLVNRTLARCRGGCGKHPADFPSCRVQVAVPVRPARGFCRHAPCTSADS